MVGRGPSSFWPLSNCQVTRRLQDVVPATVSSLCAKLKRFHQVFDLSLKKNVPFHIHQSILTVIRLISGDE